jgi:hypothetical protein
MNRGGIMDSYSVKSVLLHDSPIETGNFHNEPVRPVSPPPQNPGVRCFLIAAR